MRWVNAVLLFAVLINLIFIDTVQSTNSVWGYECASGICKKIEITPDRKDSALGFKVCRILCSTELGTVWPIPRKGKISQTVVAHINLNNIKFKSDTIKLDNSFWSQNEIRFNQQIHQELPKNTKLKDGGKQLNINFKIKDESLRLNYLQLDESYKLKIRSIGESVNADIEAESSFGGRHALETLAQLLVHDEIRNIVVIPVHVDIEDEPVRRHRGILLDTSRNYVSPETIKRTIDGMAMVKLNVFHWHITDSHSFPLQLKTHPDLSLYGAYSPNHIYTPDNIRDIVEYARIRGVTVLPEFDAPAHVGEGWQKKNMTVCFNEQPWSKYCVEAPCGQLDPSKDDLYKVLRDIYGEMFEYFNYPDIFHMGGDEVSVACWNTSKELQNWMIGRGWDLTENSFFKLWDYFQTRALEQVDEVAKHRIPIIMWTSTLTKVPNVDKYLSNRRYIIQVWTKADDREITELLERDFTLIMSNYDGLYLDCGFESWVGTGQNWCAPYSGWHKIYNNDFSQIPQDKQHLIMGAEAALWTEQADEQTIDSLIWPRASALAERLWSDPKISYRFAEPRMLLNRARLVAAGIRAQQIQPLWCLHNEGDCPMNKHN